MKTKLVFIMSDSEAYLRDEVIRLYNDWGFTSSNVKTVETWNPALVRSYVSLFGETSMIHLDLSDKKNLKTFADFISDKKHKELFEADNWYGPGLIITSTQAIGAKKIETLVTKSNGKVIKKAKPAEMIKLLLNKIHLNNEAKEFLKMYAGDDYQILIPIVNQLEKMPKEEQSLMKTEDLLVRLPGKPGAVPPWEFVNPMLEGNAKDAVSLYERAMEGSHVLVAMLMARNKLQLLYRLKTLQLAGVWKSDKQAEILGERNGPNIWITSKAAQKVSLETAEYLSMLSFITEANLKGYLNAETDIIFKNYIAAVCLSIKYDKVLPLAQLD